MNRARLISICLLVCSLGAISAIAMPAAQAGAAPTTTSTTPTTPAVPTSAKIRAERLLRVAGKRVTVTGEGVKIVGTVTPYVPGQTVVLEAFVSGHRFGKATLNIKHDSSYGVYRWTLKTRRTGLVRVVVVHAATATLGAFTSKAQYTVLASHATFGESGPIVQLIQQRLKALHFYIPQTGVYDQKTGLALDTYHRLLGWGVSQIANTATVDALIKGKGHFIVHFRHQGFHVEGDLTDQVLAIINGTKVSWLLPISSGKPSTPTILGSFQIYYREPEYTSDGMYFSDFFTGGYAIHGYAPAPDYPASHGCMRLPMVDAIPVYNRLALGEWVDTYYTSSYRYDWVGDDI
jgi:hypothetical protein